MMLFPMFNVNIVKTIYINRRVNIIPNKIVPILTTFWKENLSKNPIMFQNDSPSLVSRLHIQTCILSPPKNHPEASCRAHTHGQLFPIIRSITETANMYVCLGKYWCF